MNGDLEAMDRVLILDLIARCAQALDSGDEDGFAGCFVETGVFEGVDGRRLTGPEQLRGRVREAALRPTFRHMVTNTVIDPVKGESNRAHSQSYFVYYFVEPAGRSVQLSGRYLDELTKVDGAWRLARRRVVLDQPRQG